MLSADYGDLGEMEDIFVPEELIGEEELAALVTDRAPRIVSSTVDEATGVHQRVLSNGIRVNYVVRLGAPPTRPRHLPGHSPGAQLRRPLLTRCLCVISSHVSTCYRHSTLAWWSALVSLF